MLTEVDLISDAVMKKFLFVCRQVLSVAFFVFFFVCSVFGFGYVNLKFHAVYYASHTPHRAGVDPVLIEFGDNLFWGGSCPDLSGIRCDFDGTSAIFNENYKDVETPYFSANGAGEYDYSSSDGVHHYNFDKNFRLVYASREYKGIKLSDVNVDEVKAEIYKIFGSAIEYKSRIKPIVNLQWVYDYVNRSRFN